VTEILVHLLDYIRTSGSLAATPGSYMNRSASLSPITSAMLRYVTWKTQQKTGTNQRKLTATCNIPDHYTDTTQMTAFGTCFEYNISRKYRQ